MTALFEGRERATVRALEREAQVTRWWFAVAWGVVTLVIAVIAVTTAPSGFAPLFGILIVGAVAIAIRPAIGIYLIALFGAMGDSVTASWYPFVKNFSSAESTLFVSPALTISPAELYVGLTIASWIIHMAARHEWQLRRGPLFWPTSVLVALVTVAFVRGVGSGGDLRVALFEVRPFFLMWGIFVAAVNLLTQPRQWRIVMWLLMVGITVNGIFAIGFLDSLSKPDRDALESLIDHPGAVQMNLLFVLVVAAWVYRSSLGWRRLLPLMGLPVAYAYLVSQRRAAIVGLLGAAMLAAVLMFWNHRKRFWRVMPVLTLLAAGYVGAFWNVETGPGFPAQAVKAIVAPNDVNSHDQASDVYRTLENIDLLVTIKAEPLTGIGYGQQFYRPVQLPDISTFEFWQYIPHNSVMAIWMKTGIFGFLAMLAVFGVGLRTGALALQGRRGDDAAMTFTATAFLVMFATYAYVDIAWDMRSTIYVGLCLGLLTTMYATRPLPARGDET